jgi:midasin
MLSDSVPRNVCDIASIILRGCRGSGELAATQFESDTGTLGAYFYPMKTLAQAALEISSPESRNDGRLNLYLAIAKAFVQFALALIALYVPDKPHDPAAREIVNKRRNEFEVSDLLAKVETRRSIENRLRPVPSKRLEAETSKLESLRGNGIESRNFMIYRPQISQIPQIQQDLIQLLEITIRKDEVLRSEKFDTAKVQLVLGNLEQIASRLQQNYPYYRDYLTFVTASISRLTFGLKLGADAREFLDRIPESPAISSLFLSQIICPPTVEEWKSFRRIADEGNWSAMLNLFLLERTCFSASLDPTSEGSPDLTSRIFDDCYIRWRVAKEKQKIVEASKTSIYKPRDEEDGFEAAIAELFPDQEFDQRTLSETSKEDQLGIATRIARSHQLLYLDSEPNRDAIPISQILEHGLDIAIKCSDQILGEELLPLAYPSIILSLASSRHSLDHVSLSSYDFYRSPHFSETREYLDIVGNVERLTASLLENWPDHATLNDISRLCSKIWEISNSTPLSSVLPFVERLYALTDQWQQVTSREYAMTSPINRLRDMIVRWRRLELSSWKSLFEAEERRHGQEVWTWWFNLYEVTIYNLRSDGLSADHVDKVVGALNDFVITGSLGDFTQRLQLLHSFAMQAHSVNENQQASATISQACFHIYHLYSLYIPTIQKAISTKKATLEKELAETVQLASWRDTSVYALNESAKKSHRRLFRTIKKYRELLSEPISPILQEMTTVELRNALIPRSPSARMSVPLNEGRVLNSVSFCRANSIWSAKAQSLLDPLKLSISIQSIFNRSQKLESPLPMSPTDLIESIDDLKKQTPSTLTDENEKHVKFLKGQKRRLFTQTMKTLREWGISSKVTSKDAASPGEAFRISSLPVDNNSQPVFGGVNKSFYRILDLLPRIRGVGSAHSADLSDIEFNRAQGNLETLVDLLFEQRSLCFDFAKAVWSLRDKYVKTIKQLARVEVTQDWSWVISLNAKDYIQRHHTHLSRLRVILKASQYVLDSHKQLDDNANIFPCQAQLKPFEHECVEWISRLSKSITSDHVLFPETLRLCQDIKSWCMSVSQTIEAMGRQYPVLKYSFKPIDQILEQAISIESLSPTSLKEEIPDSSDFKITVEQLAISTLGAVQDIAQLLSSSDLSPRCPQTKRFHAEVTNKLRPMNILNKVRVAFETSLPLLETRHGLRYVLAAFNSVIPILDQYIHGCELVQHHLIAYHGDFSELVHVLLLAFYTLATKGYCSPQRAEKEGAPTKGDGVGLGEGEGETDISNEIKDDENLDDLGQQNNEGSGEQKGEDNENGVEMEDDFAGDLGDAPEGEREEEEDESGEDEMDEMDEGTGPVDDNDPTAVDEQFWEDQAKQPPESADLSERSGKKETEGQEGDLGANNQERKDESKRESEERNENQQDEDSTEENAHEIDEVDEEAIQNRKDDSFMPEAQPLDIPDDLDLNQPDGKAMEESDFSGEDMEFDDVDDEQEQVENEGKEQEDEMDETHEGNEMEVDEDRAEDAAENEDLNTKNVDQSEYQGDDVVASEAKGKGGETATSTEDQGQQGDEQSIEDRPESTEDQKSDQRETADGHGKAGLDSKTSKEEDNDDGDAKIQKGSAKENPFKKLGDVLEQWRRDLGKIQDVADETQPEEKTVGEQNPEYSYVNEDEQFDTQGLGPAAPEQVQPLDMSMAIDEEAPPREVQKREELLDTSRQTMDVDVEMKSHPAAFGATIGDRSQQPSYSQQLDPTGTTAMEDSPQDPSTTTLEILHAATTPIVITDDARQIWQQHDRATHDLSLALCEQLRLILEPTLATKMRGDFRTGKRLNLRRIIPYIASDYKKDKIWMRRTKPSKRQYQVMIAMDDSKSMSDSKSVKLAFDTLALTAKALSQLEVGQISIVRFGEDVKTVHGFQEPFNAESGGRAVQQFQFDQAKTDVCALTKSSIELFDVARRRQDVRSTSGTELWQLELIISDGICEDHDTIRRLVREALDVNIMMIFVILDAIHPERKDSILDIKSYSFVAGENGQVVKETRYLDSFPFNYFVIVRDIRELPAVLASALRQWFAEVAER